MSRVTRFAARDPGPAARMAGFMAHLRGNGFALGVAETALAQAALTELDALDPETARLALKCVCTGRAEDATRFDAAFDAYWLNAGRVRPRAVPKPADAAAARGRNSRTDHQDESAAPGKRHAPDDGAGDAAGAGDTGRLQAVQAGHLRSRDLRELVSPGDIRAAETVARRLGAALRDRRSRRSRADRRGARLDFRRTLRSSLSTGGEPLRLHNRARPDRPVRLVTLCDMSGSMIRYARPYLAFLSGLMRADPDTDAYLFHTRLVRISDALRDPDPLRAVNRLSLLSEGLGGGSRIGGAVSDFAHGPARRSVGGRTVVMILSDGYDSDPPEVLAAALERLKKRGCKVVWLNPLKGWAGYAPVARGMAAALPHLDLFHPATTLDDLAALEKELTRL
ncbi:vWA domain-containing protein [Roseovarius salinarum]|uniref:vWA domain-containing protein n=1 Tax=Roseovarius salinarum TaxID=1981892 RepID=UPI000C34B2AF|nr:VWA domain-containing protein [Roseovarius salinarum]